MHGTLRECFQGHVRDPRISGPFLHSLESATDHMTQSNNNVRYRPQGSLSGNCNDNEEGSARSTHPQCLTRGVRPSEGIAVKFQVEEHRSMRILIAPQKTKLSLASIP